MSFRRGPKAGTGAKPRRPGRLVFDDHQSFERRQVLAGGRRLQVVVRPVYVTGDRRERSVGGHVASQRMQETPHPLGVAPDPVHSFEIHPADIFQIVPVGQHGCRCWGIEMSRPAADAQEFRQLFGGKLCGAPGYRLSVEKSAEGDLGRSSGQVPRVTSAAIEGGLSCRRRCGGSRRRVEPQSR